MTTAKISSGAAILALVLAATMPVYAGDASGGSSGGSSGYTISRTAGGIRLTVHFERRAHPSHTLIAVTATLRNLSHRHLTVYRHFPYGLCSWPVISIVSVDAAGRYAEPFPPIPRPSPECPFPPVRTLPVGKSIVEHQLIVLWTPRLHISAHLFNFVHNCYCGFEFQGPPAKFHLSSAAAPTISVETRAGATVASVSPPSGVRGPFYYQSWGSCATSQSISGTFYWTARRDRVVPSICAHPVQWHLDVAWLNMPVASLNLGATHLQASFAVPA